MGIVAHQGESDSANSRLVVLEFPFIVLKNKDYFFDDVPFEYIDVPLPSNSQNQIRLWKFYQ